MAKKNAGVVWLLVERERWPALQLGYLGKELLPEGLSHIDGCFLATYG